MTDVNYFDGQNTAGNGNTSGGSWVALLAGLGAVALGAYALLRGGKTSSSANTGLGGYIESLGGGSGEELFGKGSGSTGGSGSSGGSSSDSSGKSFGGEGSAIAAFAESYGANPSSVANVFGLSNYGNEETNSILGVKYQNYLNTEKTLVTDASGNLVSLGSDLDPILGLGNTIIFHQEKGEGLAGTPDSNALAASGLLAGAIAGVSQEEAPIAAATSLAKWFDSPYIKDSSKANQAAAMGLAWSPQTGLTSRQSAVAAQQQAQVAAAKQTNATIAARQVAEKEAARKAAEAARQAEANRQAAIAAQQQAQAAKSSGGSGGFSTADRVASGGSSSSHGFFTGYTSKGSGGSSGGSSGGATPTAAGGKTTSGSSSGKSSGGSYSVSTSSGTSSFTGSGGRLHH